MPGTCDIAHIRRLVAMLLLIVSVLLGPGGLGGWTVFASACPCDDAMQTDHASEYTEADPCDDDKRTDSGHDNDDECPDDCPDCDCCPGLGLAVLSLPMTRCATSWCAALMLAPVDASATGASIGVFRPPRSLT